MLSRTRTMPYTSRPVCLFIPRDLSGSSYVRTRFKGADVPDQFLLYVPSMRRIRRLSGRDTQDPLFGSDLVWDDYNIYWQKVSSTEFPNEYKIIKKTEMLLPTFVDYNWPDDRQSRPDIHGLQD